jgi:hypothetical protein
MYLNLVTNAAIVWNTVSMGAVSTSINYLALAATSR